MLHVCIDGIAKTVKDQHKFKWPIGNLSLIQPTGIDEPLSYEYPLMLNWSEIKAKKRDEYNSENERGHGKFHDVIGEDHREAKVAKEGTLPEIVIERLKKEGLIYKPSFKDINPSGRRCAVPAL
ncbi:hypothetical protein D1007_08547 [Hordeum vulgare]|nr:hypothetical protein D1007_08547 [Hordeum vulgare]